jgi:hypothetical protein
VNDVNAIAGALSRAAAKHPISGTIGPQFSTTKFVAEILKIQIIQQFQSSAPLLHFCHFSLDMAEMSGSIVGKRAVAGALAEGPVEFAVSLRWSG